MESCLLSMNSNVSLLLAISLYATLLPKFPPTTDSHANFSIPNTQYPIPNPQFRHSPDPPTIRQPSLKKKPKLPGCSARQLSSCPVAFGTSAAAGWGKGWEKGSLAELLRMEQDGAAAHPSGSSGLCVTGRTLLSLRESWEGQGSSREGCGLRGCCRGRVSPCSHGGRLPL